jgi:hypothetical protein
MSIETVVHYLTVMVAFGVALAVFGMFYRGKDGEKMWNAGLLIAALGIFSQEWVLRAPPWPLPALVTGLITLLLLVRLVIVVRSKNPNRPIPALWKGDSSANPLP